jgi:hypothetical protein
MIAVQFGGYADGERDFLPGRLDAIAVRDGPHQVAAELEHCLDVAFEDFLASLHGVQAFAARRLEIILLGEFVERHQFRFFSNADGALALHIGMAAHRADAGTLAADIATQQ